MRYLNPPVDKKNATKFDTGNVFDTCVSMVKNPALKAELCGVRQQVEDAAADYDAKAETGSLHLRTPHDHVGTVTAEKLIKVYTLRMVPKRATGRPIYDRIMSAPAHRRCPLCGLGTVNTLDHFLPKTHFPIFSVTPNNLVPACTWCQGKKLEYYSTTAGGQLLHPYFDDVDNEVWLVAEVVVGAPVVFRYSACPPDHWAPSTKARVATHLEKLNLPLLFSLNAGSRLTEIRARLEKPLQKEGGADAVREHLIEELSSMEEDHKNSWSAAMYRAAAASDWFCNGGFLGV
ncbi:MAG: hypothetical protein HQL99_17405 [Magnetococcales bacterium]|nr:hypothetical protein [Magnetococcales bacterium]